MIPAEITILGLVNNEEIMYHTELINAYFKASKEERLEFFNIIKNFEQTNDHIPLTEGFESFSVNESIRKSQSINFAPSTTGCPVCGR